MSNRVVIIGVYFGELPQYFPLWLKSCEANPCLDFVIFSDQQLTSLPVNVRWYPMTLQKMKTLAEKVLGFSVCLDRPYKCCDFKPIYGLIFRERTEGYDYWGHCDFDMIFGDLQGYFECCELHKFDRFLTLGHLCLYRNTEDVNNRYKIDKDISDYTAVYTSSDIYGFDEFQGMTKIYDRHRFPMFTERVFADISTVYSRYRLTGAYPMDGILNDYRHQVFCWEDGKIYRFFYLNGSFQREEFLYVHFQKRPNYNIYCEVEGTNAFYITNRGFFAKNGEVTLEDIKKYNPYPGWLYEQYEWIRYKTRKQVQRVKRFVRKVISQDGQQ